MASSGTASNWVWSSTPPVGSRPTRHGMFLTDPVVTLP